MAKKRPTRTPSRAGGPTREDPHTALMAGGPEPGTPTRRPAKKEPTAKPRASKIAKLWEGRLMRADKVYDEWSERYECRKLDDYYEGKQWRGLSEEEAKAKYVINMVFATMETQLPSLMFSKPKVKAEARPESEQTATSNAGGRATLIEQTLQTQIDNPRLHFNFETTLALRDAYSRFGVVEVGYTADYLDNPNAGKPILREDEKPVIDDDGTEIKEPRYKVSKESLFLKRIPAENFRVGKSHNALTSNDWIAYCEWVPIEDVKRNTAYENTEGIQSSGVQVPVDDKSDQDEIDEDELQQKAGQVRLWRIYDLRQKMRHVHAEGHPALLQHDKPFTYLPFSVLKFFERRNAFYPQPPIYNWLGPQDEINETREMQKVHRRRAVRRYMYEKGIDKPEIEKLESGEDLTAIAVAQVNPPPIVPISDAPLSPSNTTEELAISHQDLNLIAGVTGESRGEPSSPTATQANIINARASMRESHARTQVAQWLAEIARLMLLTMREKMKLPFMVKQTVDPFAFVNDPEHTQSQAQLWKEIESEDIDNLDVDISIDVASLSPVAEEAQRNQWNVVLSLLTNPALATLLMTPNPKAPEDPSPLLRKTLMLNGVTSDQEIREIWRVGQSILQSAKEAAMSQAAISKQPEPMKISLALKGEDLINPLYGPMLMQILAREEQMPLAAAATARPESPLSPAGGSGVSIPAPGTGAPSGVPAVGAAG